MNNTSWCVLLIQKFIDFTNIIIKIITFNNFKKKANKEKCDTNVTVTKDSKKVKNLPKIIQKDNIITFTVKNKDNSTLSRSIEMVSEWEIIKREELNEIS